MKTTEQMNCLQADDGCRGCRGARIDTYLDRKCQRPLRDLCVLSVKIERTGLRGRSAIKNKKSLVSKALSQSGA